MYIAIPLQFICSYNTSLSKEITSKDVFRHFLNSSSIFQLHDYKPFSPEEEKFFETDLNGFSNSQTFIPISKTVHSKSSQKQWATKVQTKRERRGSSRTIPQPNTAPRTRSHRSHPSLPPPFPSIIKVSQTLTNGPLAHNFPFASRKRWQREKQQVPVDRSCDAFSAGWRKGGKPRVV